MSTSAQIQEVIRIEKRYPTDFVHNGHSYQKGYQVQSESVRHLREYRKKQNAKRPS